jgi:two-component system OmpR family sensor kinase
VRIRSIRTRLTLWYSSLLTLTLLVLASTAYGLLTYSLSHDLDVALKGVAKAMAESVQSGTTRLFPSDIDRVFQEFFGFSPLERYFEILDPTGRGGTRGSSDQSGKLSLSPEALKNAAEGRPTFETVVGTDNYPVRVLTVPVQEGGHVTSLIQVGMSLKGMYTTRRRFLLIMAAVLPLGILMAGGVGWLLARRAFKPVDQMTEAAHRIGAKHLAERLEEPGTGDELDRLAKTLNQMLGRLDAAFHQIRQFSADASHELQTPLTILKGQLEVALRSVRSPEEYQRILKSSLEETDRIAHLVDGLLLLARADAGVLKMDRRPVDLTQLIEEVCEQAKVLAEVNEVVLRLGRVEPLLVQGDQERLRRLLLNLVDNGIKFTPRGGQITISLRVDSSTASIVVSDTGVGLSLEEQGKVFQPFYRAEGGHTENKQGVGLGLSIVRSIAEAHGWRIQLESTPGLGSQFTLLIPLSAS